MYEPPTPEQIKEANEAAAARRLAQREAAQSRADIERAKLEAAAREDS